MRAEEGDESVNDYADQARQAREEVGGPNSGSWPRRILRFFGFSGGKRGPRHGQDG